LIFINLSSSSIKLNNLYSYVTTKSAVIQLFRKIIHNKFSKNSIDISKKFGYNGIAFQNNRKELSDMYYHRHIEAVAERISRRKPVLVLTGARQVGKSTMLKEVYKNINYITLNRPLVR